MLAAGTDQIITLSDRWTVSTADGRLSAHFEHTVAVTADGPAVLTGGGIWDRPHQSGGRGYLEVPGTGAPQSTTMAHS